MTTLSALPDRPALRCAICGKRPSELDCYTSQLFSETGKRMWESADAYVWSEEGTLNKATGHFLCDGCYVIAGMPTAMGGWKVPEFTLTYPEQNDSSSGPTGR